MKRQRLVALMMALGSTLIGSTSPAWSQDLIEFSDVVIFATNSIEINQNADVLSGDVVVNDVSNGPTLAPGVELEIERVVIIADDVRADSIAFANQAQVLGDVECNDGSGVTCLGLGLPVFTPDEVPPFVEAVLRAEPPQPHDAGLGEDVATGVGGTVVLDAGFYGDITIDKGGTVVFSGGVYNIGSVMRVSSSGGPCSSDPCRSLEFLAPTELRIFGKLDIGKDGSIGPADGSGLAASDIVLYVGGTNLDPDDPSSLPPAAWIGQSSTVDANVYAGNGTLLIDKNSIVTGAFLGRDIRIDKDVQVTLDTFFAPSFFNPLPTADAQAVLTDGTEPLVITLTGSDPDGEALTFSIDVFPTQGTLGPITSTGPSSAEVTYTANSPGDLEDEFTFRVTDPAGGFDDAVVSINPVDPGEDPPQLTGEVVGKDDSLEAIKDTELDITLVGFADVADPAAVGDFTFAIISGPTNGTLDPDPPAPSVPTASDLAPPVPAELFDSVRTAETAYIPGLGFEGTDSFVFEVCGDLDGNGDTLGTGECDTATVSITVGAFNPPAPPVAPVAEDQTVVTVQGKPAQIDLSEQSGEGSSEPGTGRDPSLFGGLTKSSGAAGENNPALFRLKATALTVDGGWTFFNDCAIGTACPDGPFTFSIASGGACVSVTDAFLKSDEYTVADNGQTLGATSAGVPDDGVSQTDPDLAFADPDYSSGTFVVGSGSHSIDVTRNAGLPGLAAAYIRVDSPGTAFCAAFTNLTATSFSAPTEAELGEVIGDQIQVTVTNTGTVDIAAGTLSSIGFYVSTDSAITTSDTLLIGGRENLATSAPSGLAVGASITDFLFAGAGIDTASPEGDVFIGVVVDEFNTILESDETDNTASQAIRIGPPKPDLVVSSLTHSPASPDTNTQIELTAVVANVGNASAGASTLCFTIGSETCGVDTNFSVPSLEPGATSSDVLRIETLPAGSFQATAIADIEGVVDESVETNNTATDTVVVTDVGEPVLVATITTLPTNGTLFDSNGVEITAVGTTVTSTMVTYVPDAGATGTDFFEYTLTDQSTGLTSLQGRIDLTITQIIDECVLVGRDPGCTAGS